MISKTLDWVPRISTLEQSRSLRAHRAIQTGTTKYFSVDSTEVLNKRISPQQKNNIFVNWTRLEQDSNLIITLFAKTSLSKLISKQILEGFELPTMLYYLSAKTFLERRHWFCLPSHKQKLPFPKPQLSCKWPCLKQGHNVSSPTRATGTKPNLHMGMQLLSVFVLVNSTEEHQDSIPQLRLCFSTMATSNMVLWGLTNIS